MKKYDFIIIGAGVIGSTISRELSRYQVEVLLIDKENDVSCGATKGNSAIVHGGFDDKHGSLKSKLCREGNLMYPKLNEELNFGYEQRGSLVLAFSEEEIEVLGELYENGKKNGVDDLEIIDADKIIEMEPYVNKNVLKALYCPSSGLTSPYELTIALAENAISNGVELKLKSEVLSIEQVEGGFKVVTNNDEYSSKYVINCAGVYSDKVAGMVGVDHFKITPRRGEYVLLNKDQGYLANNVLFQTPSKNGKGILVTRTYHGNLMLGPNAQEVGSKDDIGTTLEALDYIVDTARLSVPDFDLKTTLTSFSGIRATSDKKDFIIEESEVKGFINVAGIESPGLTSSPAIGKYVIGIIKGMGVELLDKPDFNPYRKAIIIKKGENFDGFIDAPTPDKNIICRCEKVTEAEIIDAIHRGIDIDSLDAIKRRTRAGMGLCQGKFCGPRVANVIAREQNMKVEDVTPRGKGSSILPHREDRTFWKKLD
ncbi:MAG: FAD/NAD(P)-binding oxidoreductase [Firmicutes bacterium HGW-Firmicutes-1]|jgi:glycerol-3-phosphate dehydrogenase|nr:MAG: FAD/NAD(P)-binding oxidoreductase [Firmicutes bacterium HGW-Firmicutes-1]